MPAPTIDPDNELTHPDQNRQDHESFSQWFERVYMRQENGEWVPRVDAPAPRGRTGWAVVYDDTVEPRFVSSYANNTKQQAVYNAIQNTKGAIIDEYKSINDILSGIGKLKTRLENLMALNCQLEATNEGTEGT